MFNFSKHAWTAGGVIAMALVQCNGVSAQPPRHLIIEPKFERLPDGDVLSRYFPSAALKAGVAGNATIKCDVMLNHRVANCRVTTEEPAGFGFGAASLQVADSLRASPRTVDGEPDNGGTLSTKIHFAYPTVPNQSVGAGATFVQKVVWEKTPTFQEVEASYPQNSTGRGSVELGCQSERNGGLQNCIILTETPIGSAFGAAALKLAPLFKSKSSAIQPNGETLFVTVSIVFVPPKG